MLLSLIVIISQFIDSNFVFADVAPCQCEGAYKDYDPGKGYYYDRVSGLIVKSVSARFACVYTCKNAQGKSSPLTYILTESHHARSVGGPQQAKWFICPYSIRAFIPKHANGQVLYYETEPFGPFYPAESIMPDFKNWAAQNNCK
jgi:hypothetical protein